jgi:hypothetical protein
MTIKLNHTIVYSRDKQASAAFLTQLFGLPAPVAFGPFLGVEVGNEVTLDFFDDEGGGTPQHSRRTRQRRLMVLAGLRVLWQAHSGSKSVEKTR